MEITLKIDTQDLIQLITNAYHPEGYDMSEIKITEIVYAAANCRDTINYDRLYDAIKVNTSMYYFYPIPGKLNMNDFENDYSYMYPWKEYVDDCTNYSNCDPDKEEWHREIAGMIPEGALVTEYGIIVRS